MKLSDICEVYSGYALKSFNDSEEGLPVVKIGNILTDGTLNLDECQYTADNVNEKYYSNKGDIYIALSGATTGKIGIMHSDEKYIINQRVGIVRKKTENIPQNYIKYFLLRQTNRILQEAAGCAQPNISPKQIAEYLVPNISEDEMMNICLTLDKVKGVIDSRKQELEQLDFLIKARFVEMFGDPVDNPLGWKKKQLQKIVTDDCTISYGIVQTGDDQKEGVPVLRPVDIVNRIPKLEELKKTTKEISDKYKRTILKGREMLITVRANIGDTCIVGEEFKGCNVGRGIVPIRTREDVIILDFLKHLIDSRHLNDEIKSKAKGITLIQLNMEDLREVELILPSIEKQKSFVAFAKQVDKSKVEGVNCK
jgi:type I restriction enzyme S subunit